MLVPSVKTFNSLTEEVNCDIKLSKEDEKQLDTLAGIDNVSNYIETICKEAKGGKINKDLLDKVRNKNILYSGINFAAGFTVAALFLSTLIPKFQYYVTKKTTGVDAFPGTYDYAKHQEEDD